MIITFYKPRFWDAIHREGIRPPVEDPDAVLSEVFDICLSVDQPVFTSESLFNRLVIELWNRRALGCLSLDRQEFAGQLKRRGWTYNPRTHGWSHLNSADCMPSAPTLF